MGEPLLFQVHFDFILLDAFPDNLQVVFQSVTYLKQLVVVQSFVYDTGSIVEDVEQFYAQHNELGP